ncbi:MAG TPA: S8 family serine peptidase, partial [Acidimicrobiales bacterium]
EISGTSMACPAVTGMAARVLAASDVLQMPRDTKRSDAIAKAVLTSAKSLGFAPNFAGHGMPEP